MPDPLHNNHSTQISYIDLSVIDMDKEKNVVALYIYHL